MPSIEKAMEKWANYPGFNDRPKPVRPVLKPNPASAKGLCVALPLEGLAARYVLKRFTAGMIRKQL